MTKPDGPRIFIFGYGFSASALADRLRTKGFTIAATCRTAEKQADLRQRGIEAHIFDTDHPLGNARELLGKASHLLSSIPPGEAGDPVLNAHAADIRAAGPFDWIGYLSTTGVYGDRQGGWVDETSALEPTGERGMRRVTAERAWFEMGDAGPVHTFRLAGIYGPGRNALEVVKSGKAKRIVKPGQIFSRIHIEDIAETLLASMDKPNGGAAYNVCDDNAAPPQEVIEYACKLLGVEPPPEIPFVEAEMSPMARSFYRDNKQVDNSRIKSELGVRLNYPDYPAGLQDILNRMR